MHVVRKTASRSNRSISSIGLGAHEYLVGFNSVGQVKASGVPDAERPREKARQLCDIRRNAPRLVLGEQLAANTKTNPKREKRSLGSQFVASLGFYGSAATGLSGLGVAVQPGLMCGPLTHPPLISPCKIVTAALGSTGSNSSTDHGAGKRRATADLRTLSEF